MSSDRSERLKFVRLSMVLSSLCPLFLLWAVRGNELFPDVYFVAACVALAILPSSVMFWRVSIVKKNKDRQRIVVGTTENQRSHILSYLFAILLPFYRTAMDDHREFAAMCVALAFIVFLFWWLNLHYVNVIFALFRYHVYTVYPSVDGNLNAVHGVFVLITHRNILEQGEKITAYRLSNTVYWELR